MFSWQCIFPIVLTLLWSGAGLAQDAATVRLGFLLNFARYVEWPETALKPNAPLRICLVLGDGAVAGRADELGKQSVREHSIQVKHVLRPTDVGDCQIVYFPSDLPATFLANWIQTIAGTPSLTVSETPDFIEIGGMIGLVEVGGRYRFDVNLGNVRRSGLRMSSYLLKLARTVK